MNLDCTKVIVIFQDQFVYPVAFQRLGNQEVVMPSYSSPPRKPTAAAEYSVIRGFENKGIFSMSAAQVLNLVAELRNVFGEWDRYKLCVTIHLKIN